MHLRYDYTAAAFESKEMRHAQTVMDELGITYQHSTPQSMGDQFWFWNCENVPDKLPPFITPLNLDPMKCIGFGLSKEIAEKIIGYKSITQAEDRHEVVEPKPGDIIRWRDTGSGNIIEASLIIKWKDWYIVDLSGCAYSVYKKNVIPKYQDWQLNEQLEHILNWYKHYDTEVNETIQKIQSLLTVKVPTKEECVAEYNRLIKDADLFHENALWAMVNNFMQFNRK